jgi:folate-binding protein YgfZ
MREPRWFWWPRDFVGVRGPDAEAYLQGQLSQDVAVLSPPAGHPAAEGRSSRAWSWLLQPTGKVDALVRVHRFTDDGFVLETDAGWGEHVERRLTKFLLRTKAEVTALPDWRCLTVRGDVGAPDDDLLPGLPGIDSVGPSDDVTPRDDVAQGTAEEWERLRIMAGVPKMGAELTDATIPAEAGQWWIDRTVSFTKGCYTGQELVARIDSRGGHVPRPIRGVVFADGATAPGGAAIVTADGKEVGALTSVAGDVALATVARAVEPGTDVVVGGVAARIAALPLLS